MDGNRFWDNVTRHFQYYTENAPEGVFVSGSPEDPFDVAHILRGSELFFDIFDNPDEVHELMELSTQLVIETEKKLRTITGHYRNGKINECPSLDGLWLDGIRIAGDSLVMISEEMIREFVRPCYQKIAGFFGCRLYIHFCSVSPLAGEQILNAFLDSPDVIGLSTQYGLELFEKRYQDCKGKMMFDTCYEGAHDFYIEKHGSFENWARYLKNNFAESSGLIINIKVASKETGERLWDEWNKGWDTNLSMV